MRYRARLLSLFSLRPFCILFLIVGLLSAFAVLARPTDRLQKVEKVVYNITLSQVLIREYGTAEGSVPTGAVFLRADQIDKDGTLLGVERFYKDDQPPVTALDEGTVSVLETNLGEISYPKGREEEYIRHARDHAKDFEYPESDGITINDWKYLTTLVAELCSPLVNQGLNEKLKTEMDKVMSIKANEEIYLIEYLTRTHSKYAVPTSGEVSVLIGATNIIHSSPVDPRIRVARKHYIGRTVKPTSLKDLYDYAKTHPKFKGSAAEVEDLMKVEETWRRDSAQPRARYSGKKTLDQWKSADAILNGLFAKKSISATTQGAYREIRRKRLSAYISQVETRKQTIRVIAKTNWEKKARRFRGRKPYERPPLKLLIFKPPRAST
ncbi:hypothetical protein FB446DRAFT_746921 [Lentinula raphanica]|nr:hypothetical protein FB446DRAFT_746921 [Lentinula raphanica]